MPDWSYQPIFKPLLFTLPAEFSRDLTLWSMGALAKLPFGSQFIDLLGHMRPPANLRRTVWGVDFPSPVGLGAGLDVHAAALPALARFGFGFLEIGPVTVMPVCATARIERRRNEQAIWYPDQFANDGLTALAARLDQIGRLPIPVGIRLRISPGAAPHEATTQCQQLMDGLAPFAAYFSMDVPEGISLDRWSSDEWARHLMAIMRIAQALPTPRPVMMCLTPDLAWKLVERILDPAVEHGACGVIVAGGISAEGGGRLVGMPARQQSLEMVRRIHDLWGEQLTIVGSGGVLEPAHALNLLDAGATLVQIHSGLVYAGPGLPKRINEMLVYFHGRKVERSPANSDEKSRWRVPGAWIWSALLGVGMLIGGMIAWLIAATRVVLPYDEAFVGLTYTQLATVNSRLLPFMVHDRITLAGTMISIGMLYTPIAVCALRKRAHWAKRAYVISASVGFASFFLFLAYGYFDPLHALAAAALFGFFVAGLRWRADEGAEITQPDLWNDWRWRRGYWGQLLFVTIGVGLTLAGVTIAAIGATTVFVPEDLDFLHTTPAELSTINLRIVPLIAHDRAGFGGALVSDGLIVLLATLWGFRRGARWLWWMLLGAGVPGFVSGLGIHAVVGYLDMWHLAPAVVALAIYLLALFLTYPYLCAPQREIDQAD